MAHSDWLHDIAIRRKAEGRTAESKSVRTKERISLTVQVLRLPKKMHYYHCLMSKVGIICMSRVFSVQQAFKSGVKNWGREKREATLWVAV
jgi:hypothetical protein